LALEGAPARTWLDLTADIRPLLSPARTDTALVADPPEPAAADPMLEL